MVDAIAALGIYLMKSGPETRYAGLSERHTMNRYQWMLCKGQYFVILNNLEGEEALAAIMLDFAQSVVGRIPVHPLPDPFDSLPKDNRILHTQRILRGPLALQSLYTFGEGDILQIKKAARAVSSDYWSKEGKRFQQILICYKTIEDAGLVFQGIQKGLDPYLSIIDKRPTRLTFQDFAKEYGEITLSENMLQIHVHLACPTP